MSPLTSARMADQSSLSMRSTMSRRRRAGLPDIRWHDLRHSCFTLLLSRGEHPKFVQYLAGHASIQLTLDRYSHWMPTMGKHTAGAMDKALDEAEHEDGTKGEKDALRKRRGATSSSLTTRYSRCAKIKVRRRKDGREATN